MDTTKYNSLGIANPQDLGSQSPNSNLGIVYNPANEPTSPGAFKVAQQIVSNLTFKAQDSGIVNIGTQADSPAIIFLDGAKIGGAAGILIADKDYKTSSPLFTLWNSGTAYVVGNLVHFGSHNYVAIQNSTNKEPDTNPTFWQVTAPLGLPTIVLLDTFASPTAVTIQNRPDAATPFSLVTIQNNSSEASDALSVTSINVVSSHFSDIMTVAGADTTGNGNNATTFWMSDGTTPNGNLSANQGDICFNGPSGQPFYNTNGATAWTGF